ncbi:MAG: glucose-1-phosphate adenylyltransferase, partial [Planctomycetales bacterium 12-60-4]
VRKNVRFLQQKGIDYALILSGDQLYRMNYDEMLATHIQTGADVTIGALPVTREQARGFGIMRLDDDGRVRGFLEKPQTDEEIDIVKTEPAWIDARGIESKGRDCLGSMGIYLFNRDVLVDLLTKTDYHDFGKEVFPMSIRTHKVQVHLFDGYWEDIGTIRSFYEANLDLCRTDAAFRLDDENAPIFTHARMLPPTRCDGAQITQSLISDGSFIEPGAVIENSVIGLRCRIGRNVTIRNSVLMGADYFQSDAERLADAEAGQPAVGIGEGSFIEGAIVDKNCRIGKNVRISPKGLKSLPESSQIVYEEGVVVVPKDSLLNDGWTLKS